MGFRVKGLGSRIFPEFGGRCSWAAILGLVLGIMGIRV